MSCFFLVFLDLVWFDRLCSQCRWEVVQMKPVSCNYLGPWCQSYVLELV